MKAIYIKEYELHLFNKPPIMLTQEQGERLTLVIASRNPPKFVLVDGRTINVSAIEQIVPKEKWTTKPDERGIDQRVREMRELTPSEKLAHERYLRLETEMDLLPEPNQN